MNQLSPRLDRIIETLESWPRERQEAAADVLERMGALATSPYHLTSEERADLEEALAEARRGEFASVHRAS